MHQPQANISATAVLEGVRKTLSDYYHGFVAHQERLEGRPARQLPVPGSYVIGSDNAVIRPEDEFPCVWIASPGLAEDPGQIGLDIYDLRFGIVAGIFVIDDGDREEIHQTLRSMVAALRFCLLHKGVDGLDCSVDFTDEAYDVIGGERVRSMVAGEVGIIVTVQSAVVLGADPYPLGPPLDPYAPIGEGPTVLTTSVRVEKEPINA